MVAADTEVTIRAKAFSREGVRENRVLVEADSILWITGERVRGRVLVWDSVAGYYTTCHVLCRAAKERARALAAEAR